jgi:hypothetical protein
MSPFAPRPDQEGQPGPHSFHPCKSRRSRSRSNADSSPAGTPLARSWERCSAQRRYLSCPCCTCPARAAGQWLPLASDRSRSSGSGTPGRDHNVPGLPTLRPRPAAHSPPDRHNPDPGRAGRRDHARRCRPRGTTPSAFVGRPRRTRHRTGGPRISREDHPPHCRERPRRASVCRPKPPTPLLLGKLVAKAPFRTEQVLGKGL